MKQSDNRINPKSPGWLPTTRKEVLGLGWDELDIILFSGDAYIDHPSFGTAVLGRVLEKEGYKVAIVPQPNWQDDLRDFKKLGKPKLFFGVSAGAMDSMVNHYTANKRLRSDDAYTPGARAKQRPDYPTIVYTKILKQLFPETPVIIGGIEASMRRLAHYDYWQDIIKPSILIESGADLLVYGMGETAIKTISSLLAKGIPVNSLSNIKQTAIITETVSNLPENVIRLHSYNDVLADKRKYAENFKVIETESNLMESRVIVQQHGKRTVVVNPPFLSPSEKELDEIYDLPYTRLPHPKYNNKGAIPAWDMIKHSVNIHRGCFGGCSFCTISAHQGKFVSSRSEKSIISEVKKVTEMADFKGYLSDLGGPSANMYKMAGKDLKICSKCKKPSCIYPVICPNLDTDPTPLLKLYRTVRALPGIKKAFIGSGVRYDLFLDKIDQKSYRDYARELIKHHVSGRLKVAPEHTSGKVLKIMRKPSFDLYRKMQTLFDDINKREKLNQQIIPYFISSHPGCDNIDMAELAINAKELSIKPEQVQDFTPTPMTLATVMFYTGLNPYTMEKVYVAKSKDEKMAQQQFFFWYKKEYRTSINRELQKLDRKDLANKLFGSHIKPDSKRYKK